MFTNVSVFYRFEKELRNKLLGKSGNQSEEATLVKMFKFFDLQGKGAVNMKEFEKALVKIGFQYSQQQISYLFNKYDLDGSGLLDYKEFCGAVYSGSQKAHMVQ
jgi:Ca2+-binding EF-hand superfamily protein